jgi:hydrogenase/urease accessory protein HupE
MNMLQVARHWVSRILVVLSILCTSAAQAHEVIPAIADLTTANAKLTLTIKTSVEGFMAGIDLTEIKDTNASPLAKSYDALRRLPPKEIEAQFKVFWPEMAARLRLTANGQALQPQLQNIAVTDETSLDLPRQALLTVSADLPANAKSVNIGWDKVFGAMVLRQQGVDEPYTGFLEAGGESGPIEIAGGGEVSPWQTFFDYIPVGFDHIVPKGLDHILFVLGLFFFSTKLKPLLWQITAFTVAHTLTLALSSLGIISLPSTLVEPLIAASIVFVAIENVSTAGEIKPWRPFVVFAFGLLHGLGFASVLNEFGLPEGAFIPALIGFNIGVELGQLTVIAVAALLLWTWAARQPWYRRIVAIPASLAIAAVGAYWAVERTLL